MQGRKLLGGFLLLTGYAWCLSVDGQTPSGPANGGSYVPVLHNTAWRFDLDNRQALRPALPFIEFDANQDEVYDSVPDAEFWPFLVSQLPRRKGSRSALALDRRESWALVLGDPGSRRNRLAWNRCYDDPASNPLERFWWAASDPANEQL